MPQAKFDHSPLFDFLDAYAPDRKAATTALNAVVPVLQTLVRNGFIFEPLRMEDLGLLRRDLETLLGFTVREIRVIPLDTFLARLSGESEEDRQGRITRESERIEESHHDIDEVFGTFDMFMEVCVPEEAQTALDEAFDAALQGVEPEFSDPLMKETVGAMAMSLVFVPMLAMCAAVAGDPIMAGRAAAFLPWLTRCVPVGALKDAPGVFTILVSQPLA